MKNTSTLIFAEAISSFDSQTEKFIQHSLNFYIEVHNQAIITIDHRLSTLKHTDRIILLDKSQTVEEDRHNDLLANPSSLGEGYSGYSKFN